MIVLRTRGGSGDVRMSDEIYTCSRGGWTRYTQIGRLHPDDFREWVEDVFRDPEERASALRDGRFGIRGGSHGDLEWISDPAVPRGDGEWMEVFE